MTFPFALSSLASDDRHGQLPRFRLCMDNAQFIRLAFGEEALAAMLRAVEQAIGQAPGISLTEGEACGHWCLTIHGPSQRGAAAMLEALFVRLSLTPVRWGGTSLHPTLNWAAQSAGSGPDDFAHLDIATPEPGESWTQGYRIAMAIAAQAFAAMAKGQLTLAWQPVVAADDPGRQLYHETLTRFAPEAGITPASLFPALELLGMTRLFDHQVMASILDELDSFPNAVIGVNLSGASTSGGGWWLTLLDRLEKAPALARRLVVEITETAQLAEGGVHFATRLREYGCRIALDDFGVGHASIRNALMIEPDIVKLDACFIRNAGDSDRDIELLRHLAGIAANIAADVIIEGIETEAESNLARQIQSSLVPRSTACWQQGYWLGRPSTSRPWLTATAPVPK